MKQPKEQQTRSTIRGKRRMGNECTHGTHPYSFALLAPTYILTFWVGASKGPFIKRASDILPDREHIAYRPLQQRRPRLLSRTPQRGQAGKWIALEIFVGQHIPSSSPLIRLPSLPCPSRLFPSPPPVPPPARPSKPDRVHLGTINHQ